MTQESGIPDECSCGSRLFTSVWGVRREETDEPLGEGNKRMRREGYECVECGKVQLTRSVPDAHAAADALDYPDSADFDFVRGEKPQ